MTTEIRSAISKGKQDAGSGYSIHSRSPTTPFPYPSRGKTMCETCFFDLKHSKCRTALTVMSETFIFLSVILFPL